MENNEQVVSIDTSLSNKKLFKKFVVPMIITQIIMSIIQLGDRIIGAIFIGTDTLQIVTVVFPVLIVGMAFGVMIMTGLGVEVNYLIGKKEDKKAHSIASFALIIQLIISIVVGSILFLLNEQAVDFLVGGGDASIKDSAKSYLRIISLAYPFFGTGFTLSSLIMADGNPKYNMVGFMLFSLGNLIINLILVVGFDMGVDGLALGTLMSAVIFTLYNACYFIFKLNKIFKLGKVIIDFKPIGRVMYNGLSEFIVVGAIGIMMISINRIIQDNMSTNYFLSYSLLMLIVTLYTAVAEGSVYGINPINSKLLGEKNITKLKSLGVYTYIRGLAITFIIFVILIPFVKIVGSIFLTAPEGMPKEAFEIMKIDILDTLFYLYITLGLIRVLNINTTFTSGFLSSVKKPFLSLVSSSIKPILFIPVFTIIFIEYLGDNGIIYGSLLAEILFIPVMYFTLKLCIKLLRKEVKKTI